MIKENKTQKLNIAIEPSIYQKILEIARIEKRNASDVVRIAIDEKINNYESNKK
jgi:hypothetical protein